jgi:hypothetical protein
MLIITVGPSLTGKTPVSVAWTGVVGRGGELSGDGGLSGDPELASGGGLSGDAELP